MQKAVVIYTKDQLDNQLNQTYITHVDLINKNGVIEPLKEWPHNYINEISARNNQEFYPWEALEYAKVISAAKNLRIFYFNPGEKLPIPIVIDSNVILDKSKKDHYEWLKALSNAKIIILTEPSSVTDEIGNNKRNDKMHYFFSVREYNQKEKTDKFINENKGNSKFKNMEKDLTHIYQSTETWKGHGYFLTWDKGLLKKNEKLEYPVLKTPEEFIDMLTLLN